MRKVVLACLLVTVTCVVVHGQRQPQAQQQQQMQQMQKLQTAMADAQTKAIRPGDAAMNCDALQNELQAAALDPAVQNVAKENGVVAKEKLDEIEKGTAEAKAAAATQIATGIFSGLASALVPGAGLVTGRAQQAAARAEAAQAQAQTAKNLQDMNAMMDRTILILPQMMRGQRMMELAYAKQCPWIMGAIPPGTTPFAAPSSLPPGGNPFGQTPGR
jgi:type II secretory pathway pseudopilin PulG